MLGIIAPYTETVITVIVSIEQIHYIYSCFLARCLMPTLVQYVRNFNHITKESDFTEK